MMQGIYKIENRITGKVYIGQSHNVEQRWYKHTTMLNKNWHFCEKLQKDWDEYGKSKFNFVLIEDLSGEDEKVYLDREQYWIDYYGGIDSDNLYNTRDNISKMPKEMRDKISNSLKGNIPWNKGLTAETDDRVKQYSEKSKLTNGLHLSDEMKHQISEKVKHLHAEGVYDYAEMERKKKETRKRKGTVRKDKGVKRAPMSEENKRKISEGKLKANAKKRELGLPLRSDSDRYKKLREDKNE